MGIAPTTPAAVQVVFAPTHEAAHRLGGLVFAIVPDSDTWNDFGLRLYADLLVLGGTEPLEFRTSIMFDGEEDSSEFILQQLEQLGPIISAADLGVSFISLQREASAYADIVEAIGFDAAIHGLRGIHDVVLAQIEQQDDETLALFEAEPFHAGMTRSPSHYVALRRGGQHLRRTPAPLVDDAAVSFSVRATLPSAPAATRLDLDFRPDDMFQDRCCVLIGKNGVGKTQMLKALVESMATSAIKPAAGGDADHADGSIADGAPAVRRVIVFSSVRSDPYPREIEPWSGVDYEYHPVIADDAPLGRAFLLAIVDCLRSDDASFGVDTARRRRAQLLSRLLERLGLWDQLHLPIRSDAEHRFNSIVEIDGAPYARIGLNLGEYLLSLLFHSVDWERPALVLNNHGRPRHLSSGELAMANFVAQSVASVENGSLLLFDEPETHLHPSYVSEFMDTLQDLLARTRSVAVIATHSPHIVREVPRQRVNVLQQSGESGQIDVLRPQMQTFGSNVDDISRFVFGDGLISHRYQRVLAKWAETEGRKMGVERMLEHFGPTLNAETLSFIARKIRDRTGT